MRPLLAVVIVCIAATSAVGDIVVDLDDPVRHRYVTDVGPDGADPGTDPDTTWVEVEIVAIQQALNLSYNLINDAYAGYPGHDDTVVLMRGVYDSVSTFPTTYGNRTAIASVPDGVTLRGDGWTDAIIDQSAAEYGILVQNVGSTTGIHDLTIRGGVGRDRGRTDDGDGRNLVAAICCLEDASPVINRVRISGVASGVVIRSGSAPTVQNSLIARGSHHGVYVYENGGTAAVLDHVTIVDNFDCGVYVYGGEAQLTNCSITHNGKQGVKGYVTTPTVQYCNLFYNDELAPGPEGAENYGGTLVDLTGVDGNISDEPFYCDFTGASGYDYSVCFDSPNLGAGSGDSNIGAFAGGCTECATFVQDASWGAIKALYR